MPGSGRLQPSTNNVVSVTRTYYIFKRVELFEAKLKDAHLLVLSALALLSNFAFFLWKSPPGRSLLTSNAKNNTGRKNTKLQYPSDGFNSLMRCAHKTDLRVNICHSSVILTKIVFESYETSRQELMRGEGYCAKRVVE